MDISKKILKEKFNNFNQKYFNGEVCECDFKILSTDAYVGRFIDKNVIKPIICISKNDFINNEIGWDEKRLDNTLLHEMIHALIYTKHGYVPTIGCHGIRFRAISTKLYLKYGIWVGIGGIFNVIERKWNTLNTCEKIERIALTPINSLLMFIL
jgi:hypothetical protein